MAVAFSVLQIKCVSEGFECYIVGSLQVAHRLPQLFGTSYSQGYTLMCCAHFFWSGVTQCAKSSTQIRSYLNSQIERCGESAYCVSLPKSAFPLFEKNCFFRVTLNVFW